MPGKPETPSGYSIGDHRRPSSFGASQSHVAGIRGLPQVGAFA